MTTEARGHAYIGMPPEVSASYRGIARVMMGVREALDEVNELDADQARAELERGEDSLAFVEETEAAASRRLLRTGCAMARRDLERYRALLVAR